MSRPPKHDEPPEPIVSETDDISDRSDRSDKSEDIDGSLDLSVMSGSDDEELADEERNEGNGEMSSSYLPPADQQTAQHTAQHETPAAMAAAALKAAEGYMDGGTPSDYKEHYEQYDQAGNEPENEPSREPSPSRERSPSRSPSRSPPPPRSYPPQPATLATAPQSAQASTPDASLPPSSTASFSPPPSPARPTLTQPAPPPPSASGTAERVHVILRLLPLPLPPATLPRCITVTNATTLAIKTRDKKRWVSYTFDKVVGEKDGTSTVFEMIGPKIREVCGGVNTTVFAYGMTGTGKTHTMLGEGLEKRVKDGAAVEIVDEERAGVIPRSLETLFNELKRIGMGRERKGSVFDRRSIVGGSPNHANGNTPTGGGEKFAVMCSYMQIYNDLLYDLLNEEKDKKGHLKHLSIRESTRVDGNKSLYVQGLSEYRVSSPADVLELLYQGGRSRAVRATEFNEHSSRSHAILQLSVELELLQNNGTVVMRKAKLNLVDLAGSEKWGMGEKDLDTTKELVKINGSLAALGNCINALANKSRKHIPYRDSPLTRLLQDSLGGGTRTIVIATVTPHPESQEESASTLQFANRATRVNAKITINEVVNDAILLKRAQREISRLKEKLAKAMESDKMVEEKQNPSTQHLARIKSTPPLGNKESGGGRGSREGRGEKRSKDKLSLSAQLDQSMTQQDLNRLNAIAGPAVSSSPNDQRMLHLEEKFERREADLLKEIDSLRSMVLGIVETESPSSKQRRGSSIADIALADEMEEQLKEEVQDLKTAKEQMESMVLEMRNHMREMENRVSSSDAKVMDLIEKMQKGQMDQKQLETEMEALLRIKGDVEFEQKMSASQDRLAALGVVSPSRHNRTTSASIGDGAIARVMQNLSGDAKELLYAHAATQQAGTGAQQPSPYYVPASFASDGLRSPPKNVRLKSEDVAAVVAPTKREEKEELFEYEDEKPPLPTREGGAVLGSILDTAVEAEEEKSVLASSLGSAAEEDEGGVDEMLTVHDHDGQSRPQSEEQGDGHISQSNVSNVDQEASAASASASNFFQTEETSAMFNAPAKPVAVPQSVTPLDLNQTGGQKASKINPGGLSVEISRPNEEEEEEEGEGVEGEDRETTDIHNESIRAIAASPSRAPFANSEVLSPEHNFGGNNSNANTFRPMSSSYNANSLRPGSTVARPGSSLRPMSKASSYRKGSRTPGQLRGGLKTPSTARPPPTREGETEKVVALATVKFNFVAEEEGDLAMKAGTVIQVVEKCESGWWRGKYENGRLGVFPSNFVEVIEATEEMAKGKREEGGRNSSDNNNDDNNSFKSLEKTKKKTGGRGKGGEKLVEEDEEEEEGEGEEFSPKGHKTLDPPRPPGGGDGGGDRDRDRERNQMKREREQLQEQSDAVLNASVAPCDRHGLTRCVLCSLNLSQNSYVAGATTLSPLSKPPQVQRQQTSGYGGGGGGGTTFTMPPSSKPCERHYLMNCVLCSGKFSSDKFSGAGGGAGGGSPLRSNVVGLQPLGGGMGIGGGGAIKKTSGETCARHNLVDCFLCSLQSGKSAGIGGGGGGGAVASYNAMLMSPNNGMYGGGLGSAGSAGSAESEEGGVRSYMGGGGGLTLTSIPYSAAGMNFQAGVYLGGVSPGGGGGEGFQYGNGAAVSPDVHGKPVAQPSTANPIPMDKYQFGNEPTLDIGFSTSRSIASPGASSTYSAERSVEGRGGMGEGGSDAEGSDSDDSDDEGEGAAERARRKSSITWSEDLLGKQREGSEKASNSAISAMMRDEGGGVTYGRGWDAEKGQKGGGMKSKTTSGASPQQKRKAGGGASVGNAYNVGVRQMKEQRQRDMKAAREGPKGGRGRGGKGRGGGGRGGGKGDTLSRAQQALSSASAVLLDVGPA